MMRARLLVHAAMVFWLAGVWARADTLPIAPNLIDIRTPQGEQLLRNSEAFDSYVRLSSHFVTESTQAFCGVASAAIVLNALGLPPPPSPAYAPYRMFDQLNLLDGQTANIVVPSVLYRNGMTLEQLGGLLRLHAVRVDVRHAAHSTPGEFRELARKYLNGRERAVIVNYFRKTLNQEGLGHFSPLAGYDAATDRFLILDVARYKYPPVWVKTSELFSAMNTVDQQTGSKTRGFVLIQKLPSRPDRPTLFSP